jgi:hypothetical protein
MAWPQWEVPPSSEALYAINVVDFTSKHIDNYMKEGYAHVGMCMRRRQDGNDKAVEAAGCVAAEGPASGRRTTTPRFCHFTIL